MVGLSYRLDIYLILVGGWVGTKKIFLYFSATMSNGNHLKSKLLLMIEQ